MTAVSTHKLLATLNTAGFEVTILPNRGLKVVPASRLTQELRGLIRDHKVALVELLVRGAANDGKSWRVMPARGISAETLAKFRAASEKLNAAQAAAGLAPHEDPDRCCWPYSDAMNFAEIFIAKARTVHFKTRGASEAEALADQLVQRDREEDDRHLCVECRHCRPGLRCNQGLAVTDVLQRCTRFEVHPDASHTGGRARHTSAVAELPQLQDENE